MGRSAGLKNLSVTLRCETYEVRDVTGPQHYGTSTHNPSEVWAESQCVVLLILGSRYTLKAKGGGRGGQEGQRPPSHGAGRTYHFAHFPPKKKT